MADLGYAPRIAWLLAVAVGAAAAACGDDDSPAPSTVTPGVTETVDSGDGSALPDLVPVGIGISVQDPSDCQQVSNLGSFILVENAGTADAGPFVVEAGGDTFAFDGAVAGETVRKWFPRSDWGFEPVTIVVRTAEAEADTSNNSTTQVVPVPTPIPTCTPEAAGTPTPSYAGADP